jgi:hypothetical protein
MKSSLRLPSLFALLLAVALAVSGLACGPKNKFCVPGKVTGTVVGDKDGNCVDVNQPQDAGDSGAIIIGNDGSPTIIGDDAN